MTTTPVSTGDERFISLGAGGERPDMTPFSCPRCANRVLVRKNGPAQTTVQWIEDLHCPLLLNASVEIGRPLTPSCSVMNGAIDNAVLSGDIALSSHTDEL